MATKIPPSVTRLLAAIQKGGDFPAMAHTVDAISAMTSSESTSSGALAEIILQDFGLTKKLLRLVNTLAYSQHGEVTTITRAVVLMGFDRVRSLATSLIIFEHFRKKARSARLVNVLSKSFYSAVIGRTIADDTGFVDSEEAFISTLFHRLGWILVAFYLPDDFALIDAAAESDRERVTKEVLGLSFDEIGLAVADDLKLPERLSKTMSSVPADEINREMIPTERLGCLATLSNSMVDVLTTPGDATVRRRQLEQLVGSYARQIKLPDKIDTLIARTVAEVKGSAPAFQLKLAGTPLAASLAAWGVSEKGVGIGVKAPASETLDADDSESESATPRESPETVLARGLQEVEALLAGSYSFDDVLRVVLETIYRAFGVGDAKVLFLLKDPAAPAIRFRFGFGQTAEEAELWANVKVNGGTDFLSQAVSQGRDVVIRNARGPGIAQSMPGWLVRRGILDRFIVLLPLTIGRSPVGLFYIDGDKKLGSILTSTFIGHMKLLRDRAVLGIQQRTGRKA